jgi:hypothetical protein
LSRDTIELFDADWARLAEMRAAFLAQAAKRDRRRTIGPSRRDLEIYDATFGARISWKWNAVLDEIAKRGIEVPAGSVLDWGAGTGVAARAFLAKFGAQDRRVSFHDRSRAAIAFAGEQTRTEHALATLVDEVPDAPDVMLASHVLEELDDAGRRNSSRAPAARGS